MNTTDRIEAESHKDPDRLEREIDQQRDDISDIVDALGNKLSPGQLFDRMVNFGKGNGSELAQNLGNTIKAHPLPALLTSVGLAWLYAARNDAPPPTPRPTRAYGMQVGSSEGGLKERAHQVGDQLSQKMDQAQARLDDVSGKMHEAGAQVTDTVRGVAQTARQQTRRAQQGFNQMLNDNPLALGAIGVAVGALLGAALPVTEQENRLMGPASDRVTDKAKDTARSVADEARDTLQEVAKGDEDHRPDERAGSRFH